MVTPSFVISATSDRFWNLTEFIQFLTKHQGQAIELELDPEAICLENLGVYTLLDAFKFESVCIKTWNPLEQHQKYNIQFNGSNFWIRNTYEINPELHTWDLSKRFLCFYHRPTAGRLGLASYVWKNYFDQSLVHFSATIDPNNLIQFELDKLLTYDVQQASAAGEMIQHLPLLQNSSAGYTATAGYHYNDPLTSMYKHALVDIVVESHIAGRTFFPTEKTVRPMLLKKPFIIFGSKDYLAYLRQMGFRTFNDFWDEEYDGFSSGDRLKKIFNLIDMLSQKTTVELEAMYWDMQYSLDHNYNLLQQHAYQTTITQL